VSELEKLRRAACAPRQWSWGTWGRGLGHGGDPLSECGCILHQEPQAWESGVYSISHQVFPLAALWKVHFGTVISHGNLLCTSRRLF
jgi:hypothetical protein